MPARPELTEADELVAILDQFLERAAIAGDKGKLAKLIRKYQRLMKKRFAAQRNWFLSHVLPLLKHRLAEASSARSGDAARSLREADEADDQLSKALSGLLDGWLDDPDVRKEINQILKLAVAAGVDYVELEVEAEDLAAALAKLIAKGAGIQFGLDNPRAIKWLAEHAFEKISFGLDETTKERIGEVILDGLQSKKAYDAIASAIRSEFADMSNYRSQMIATYEIGNAYVQGTLAAAEDLEEAGISMEKHWLTAQDDRVSEECAANEEQGWLDLGDTFSSGDDAPLAHPNCRCALQVRKVRSTVNA